MTAICDNLLALDYVFSQFVLDGTLGSHTVLFAKIRGRAQRKLHIGHTTTNAVELDRRVIPAPTQFSTSGFGGRTRTYEKICRISTLSPGRMKFFKAHFRQR